MFLGVIVLVIGIVLILKAFGWVTAGSWALFWGILLDPITLLNPLNPPNLLNLPGLISRIDPNRYFASLPNLISIGLEILTSEK